MPPACWVSSGWPEAVAGTFALLQAKRTLMPLRLSRDEVRRGLDISADGEEACNTEVTGGSVRLGPPRPSEDDLTRRHGRSDSRSALPSLDRDPVASMRFSLLSLFALPLLALCVLPAAACERHLDGHQTSSDSAIEASQR